MNVQALRYLLAFPLIRLNDVVLEQCLKNASNLLESDQTPYYASITYENGYDRSVVNGIHRAILSRLPGKSYERFTTEKFTLRKLRPSNLWIIISSDTPYVKSLLDRQRNGTWSTYRQQILIVSDNIKPKEILAYAWSKGLVDVTFLRPNFAIIYQLNPFKKEYTRLKCINSSIIWYPEKMRDLHGHQVTIDILNDPPFCRVKRNASGHFVSSSGAESKLFKMIADKLNFRPLFVRRVENNRHSEISFLRELNIKELLENIYSGKAEMIANSRVCPFVYSTELNYTCSRTIFTTYTCPVVPIIQSRVSVNHYFFVTVACMVAIISIDLLLARFWNCYRYFWNFPVIVCLILGFPVQAQPKNKPEKIIYISLVVLSMTYLANVFNGMTNFRLNEFEEVEFTKLLDIFKNHLVPEAQYDVIPRDRSLWTVDEFGIEYNSTVRQWSSRFACLEKLIYHKNVTCLMSEIIGNLVVHASTKKYGRAVMKMSDACPWYGRSRIITARGSPYLRLINDVVPRLSASGINNWLLKQTILEYKLKEDLYKFEGELKVVAGPNIDLRFWMAFVSASLAIAAIVFFAEILIKRFSRGH